MNRRVERPDALFEGHDMGIIWREHEDLWVQWWTILGPDIRLSLVN